MDFVDRHGSEDIINHLLAILDIREILSLSQTCHRLLNLVQQSLEAQLRLACHLHDRDIRNLDARYLRDVLSGVKLRRLIGLEENLRAFNPTKLRRFKFPDHIRLDGIQNGHLLLSNHYNYKTDDTLWPDFPFTWCAIDIRAAAEGGSYEKILPTGTPEEWPKWPHLSMHYDGWDFDIANKALLVWRRLPSIFRPQLNRVHIEVRSMTQTDSIDFRFGKPYNFAKAHPEAAFESLQISGILANTGDVTFEKSGLLAVKMLDVSRERGALVFVVNWMTGTMGGVRVDHALNGPTFNSDLVFLPHDRLAVWTANVQRGPDRILIYDHKNTSCRIPPSGEIDSAIVPVSKPLISIEIESDVGGTSRLQQEFLLAWGCGLSVLHSQKVATGIAASVIDAKYNDVDADKETSSQICQISGYVNLERALNHVINEGGSSLTLDNQSTWGALWMEKRECELDKAEHERRAAPSRQARGSSRLWSVDRPDSLGFGEVENVTFRCEDFNERRYRRNNYTGERRLGALLMPQTDNREEEQAAKRIETCVHGLASAEDISFGQGYIPDTREWTIALGAREEEVVARKLHFDGERLLLIDHLDDGQDLWILDFC